MVIGSVLLFTNSCSHQATMPIVVLMKFRGYHIVWHQLTSVNSMRLCLIHDRSAKWPQTLRVVASWSHLFRCMKRDFCVGFQVLVPFLVYSFNRNSVLLLIDRGHSLHMHNL